MSHKQLETIGATSVSDAFASALLKGHFCRCLLHQYPGFAMFCNVNECEKFVKGLTVIFRFSQRPKSTERTTTIHS